MPLHLVTFNMKGFRRHDKEIEIGELAHSLRCDLLFIQKANFVSHREVEFKARFALEAFLLFATRSCTGVRVIVFNSRLMYTFSFLPDPDGRVLCFDFMIVAIRHRCVNVYAPAQHGLSSSFNRVVAVHLLFPGPIILLGDFDCVLGGQRDVRGPSQCRSI